jgi:hypothetical protein
MPGTLSGGGQAVNKECVAMALKHMITLPHYEVSTHGNIEEK